jgi:hypothetical protein
MDVERFAVEVDILVETSRDRRALCYLLSEFGEAAVCSARERLAGSRRPYVSNVAKVMGVKIPVIVETTNSPVAEDELAKMSSILKRVHEVKK